MDKFDRKYWELHFRKIARIKQTGIVDSYIIEFHRLEVMVSNISEPWLIMLFAEGLSEPLHGWVKDFKPLLYMIPSHAPRIWRMLHPRIGTFPNISFRRRGKTRNLFRREDPGKIDWMKKHGTSCEERNCASVAKNHGNRDIDVWGKVRSTT